ncbi:hypothetical protein [Longibacter sp.]|jgi:hypothetical protein|uniref:hypothetical protein n=1 Tax=Longibacter sp. TaxID=2045415 RepID=UPI003EBA8553
MIRPRSVIAAVLVLVLGCSPGAHAQDLGIEYAMTRAGYGQALQDPAGLGGYLDLPVSDRFAVRLTASHHVENASIRRSPCTGLVPPGADCSPRAFDGDARMTVVGAGLAVQPLPSTAGLQPEVYLLLTGTDIDAVFAEQEGDARLRPITPDGFSIGWSAGAQVHYALTPVFGFTGRIGVHAPQLGACGSDGWFAFCDDRTLVEFGIGMRLTWSAFFP